MTVVSGGDRTDEIRAKLVALELAGHSFVAADGYSAYAVRSNEEAADLALDFVLSEIESLRARVEAAEAERDAALAVIDEHQAYLVSMMDGENEYTSASFHLHELGQMPSDALAARDTRTRRAALETAAEIVDRIDYSNRFDPDTYGVAEKLRARAAVERQEQ